MRDSVLVALLVTVAGCDGPVALDAPTAGTLRLDVARNGTAEVRRLTLFVERVDVYYATSGPHYNAAARYPVTDMPPSTVRCHPFNTAYYSGALRTDVALDFPTGAADAANVGSFAAPHGIFNEVRVLLRDIVVEFTDPARPSVHVAPTLTCSDEPGIGVLRIVERPDGYVGTDSFWVDRHRETE